MLSFSHINRVADISENGIVDYKNPDIQCYSYYEIQNKKKKRKT